MAGHVYVSFSIMRMVYDSLFAGKIMSFSNIDVLIGLHNNLAASLGHADACDFEYFLP
jgi:hypothetical protein